MASVWAPGSSAEDGGPRPPRRAAPSASQPRSPPAGASAPSESSLATAAEVGALLAQLGDDLVDARLEARGALLELDHVPAVGGLDGPDDVARRQVGSSSNSGSANSGDHPAAREEAQVAAVGAAHGVVALRPWRGCRTRVCASLRVSRPRQHRCGRSASASAAAQAGSSAGEAGRRLRVVVGRVEDVAGADACPRPRWRAAVVSPSSTISATCACSTSPAVASATTLSSSFWASASLRTCDAVEVPADARRARPAPGPGPCVPGRMASTRPMRQTPSAPLMTGVVCRPARARRWLPMNAGSRLDSAVTKP